MRDNGEGRRCGRARAPYQQAKPSHWASASGQVCLGHHLVRRTGVRPVCFLYLTIDIYSRKIVGWEIHDHKSTVLGAGHQNL